MTTRLPGFLLLSLFAHAALLATMRAPESLPAAARILDISLLSPGSGSVTREMPNRHRNPAETRTRTPAAAPAMRRVPLPTHRASVRAAAVQSAVRPMAGQQTRARNSAPGTARGRRMIRAIWNASLPYFHYPLLAQEEGWEGRVIIQVQIDHGGYLSHAQIVDSSGHALLDTAALRTLSHVSRLPSGFLPARTTPFDLLVPVVYRLTES